MLLFALRIILAAILSPLLIVLGLIAAVWVLVAQLLDHYGLLKNEPAYRVRSVEHRQPDTLN